MQQSRLRELKSEADIGAIIEHLASRLVADGVVSDYTAIVLMEGAERFYEALGSALKRKHGVGFGKVVKAPIQSYRGTQSTCVLNGLENLDFTSMGNKILLIDDIYDTGFTMSCLIQAIRNEAPHAVHDLRSCVLFSKCTARGQKAPCDYVGLEIEDSFVVGFGLDYNGKYRDLNGLFILETPDQ